MTALRGFLASFPLKAKSTLSFLEKARKIKPHLDFSDIKSEKVYTGTE